MRRANQVHQPPLQLASTNAEQLSVEESVEDTTHTLCQRHHHLSVVSLSPRSMPVKQDASQRAVERAAQQIPGRVMLC
jgi:hypothetical protein